ncbi:MAG: 50S ribosomal protein L6, partial [Bacteroidales bacterium]
MSRIGKLPISIPAGVNVEFKDGIVAVKGPKGTLSQDILGDIAVEIEEGQVIITRPNEEKQTKALHGLYRSLINNMVIGVSEGYKKE